MRVKRHKVKAQGVKDTMEGWGINNNLSAGSRHKWSVLCPSTVDEVLVERPYLSAKAIFASRGYPQESSTVRLEMVDQHRNEAVIGASLKRSLQQFNVSPR